jgi:aryl carrier-like protein
MHQERAAHLETLGEQYVTFARRRRDLIEGLDKTEILALVERWMEAGAALRPLLARPESTPPLKEGVKCQAQRNRLEVFLQR